MNKIARAWLSFLSILGILIGCSYTHPETSDAVHRKNLTRIEMKDVNEVRQQRYNEERLDYSDDYPEKNRFSSLSDERLIWLQGDEDTRQIALTFEDGPDSEYTPAILDVLKEMNVSATFFIVGSKVEGNEIIIKRMAAEGHSIGNHTFTHSDLTKLSHERMVEEIEETENKIASAIGRRTRMVRLPNDQMNSAVAKTLANKGYEIVGWSLDSLDWKNETLTSSIAEEVVESSKSGDIVLHHDGMEQSGRMLDELPTEIHALREKGFSFVTVPKLIGIDGLD